MFTGVSAFLLTPVSAPSVSAAPRVVETDLHSSIERAQRAHVESISVLGSTGNYMYLSPAERERIIQMTRDYAAGTPFLPASVACRCIACSPM